MRGSHHRGLGRMMLPAVAELHVPRVRERTFEPYRTRAPVARGRRRPRRPVPGRRARSRWRRNTSVRSRRRAPGRRRPRRRDSCPRTRCRASRASCGCRPRSPRGSGPVPRRRSSSSSPAPSERAQRPSRQRAGAGPPRRRRRGGTPRDATLARRRPRPRSSIASAVPQFVERDVHRPTASTDGIGARSGPAATSLTTRIGSAVGDGGHRLGAEPPERDTQSGGAAPHRHVASNRLPDVAPTGRSSRTPRAPQTAGRPQQRRPRAEQHAERHHRPLAEMIHRGVRHLREPLTQVIEDGAAVPTEDGRSVCRRPWRTWAPSRARPPAGASS